jgi:hypothetical protein
MNESERSGLSVMRDCWIGGGVAANLAPPEWKEIVAAAPAADRERLLLAIAGQALDVAFRPAAPKTLVRSAPLPRLALPVLPDQLRPLFRAALKQAADARGRMRVAALAAARGFVAHPLDWMPTASDFDAPPVYAPWVDWRAQGDGKNEHVAEELSVESWDDFYPAARRIALAEIRRSDPAKARGLLEAKAAGEAAEARLALVELLHVNLSADDAPFLQGLSADRSGKVKHLAARLLARIGQRSAGDEAAAEAAELAAFIETGKSGWLRRRTAYRPRELKSQAQLQRRAELFETCQLIDLAGELGVSEEELIAGWELGGKDGADRTFAGMVIGSGSDAAVRQLAERLWTAGDLASLLIMVPRLDEAARRSCVGAILAGGTALLALLAAADGIEPGIFSQDELMRSRLYNEIRAAIAGRTEADRRPVDLGAFGLLATASAADAIAKDLIAAGLTFADTSLALLRLNAALGDNLLEEKT